MPRQRRLDLPGVPQHVIQRGNNRQPCFLREQDYRCYLRQLDEAAQAQGCWLHAYVLMTNHVHLLQSLGRRYVGYFNPTYRRSGTLWEGRYGLRHLRESLAQSAHARDHASTVGDRVESFEGESSDPFEDFVSTIAGLGVGFLLDAGSFPDHHPAHDAYAEFEKVELGTTIASALEQLADRDRSIITLHYYHHMSFVDIASHLGVTKGRVSQLHKRILNQLRAMLHEKVVEEV